MPTYTYRNDITDVNVGSSSSVEQLGLIHYEDTNPPQVALYLKIGPRVTTYETLNDEFRANAVYTDGTSVNLVTISNVQAALSSSNDDWLLVSSSQFLESTTVQNYYDLETTAQSILTANNASHRFNLDASKVLDEVSFEWRNVA